MNSKDNEILSEVLVEEVDGLNTGDKLLLFGENAKYNKQIKKMLYADRMKTRKDLLNYYEMVKNDNKWLKYTYPEIGRYMKRNLFIDTSYYMRLFFENNTWKLKRGLTLFVDFMERVTKQTELTEAGYEKTTYMIPIKDWDTTGAGNVWNFRYGINPISMVYDFLFNNGLKQLKKIFGKNDVLFVGSNKYFKINFSEIEEKDSKKLAAKFKVFIIKICKNEKFDPEDIDSTSQVDSPEVIQAKIADKIEDSKGVDITPQLVNARNKGKTPPKKPEVDAVISKGTLNQNKVDSEYDTQEVNKQKIADAIVQNTPNNNEEGVLDDIDKDSIRNALMKLDPEEDGVVISSGRAKRISQLDQKLMDTKIKGRTVKEILNDKTDHEEVKTKLNVSTPFEDWDEMSYINFDKDYNIDRDVIACFYHLQNVSLPISIRKIETKDNSTSEDRVELYTVAMEDYRGKQFTVKLDIPIMVDNRFLLRGNHKSIKTQIFNMPILKTEEDTVQIISNYMKIFVRRFRAGNGRSVPLCAKFIKTCKKYKGNSIKFTTGDNSKVCVKYVLPIDYIDIASEYSTIETRLYTFYFNQDVIREKYADIIDEGKGIPYGYHKSKKEILYYNINNEVEFTKELLFNIADSDKQFMDDVYSATKPAVCTYSRASILNSQIPVIVIAGYHVGLENVLRRADILYKISESYKKEDKTLFSDFIRFKDGYLLYSPTYKASMLLSGLKECNTRDYSIGDINSKAMFLEFLDNFGGRIKADGLDNFRDLMVDPMTKEALEHYGLPTDYIDLLILSSDLLTDNHFYKHTDASTKRFRRYQLIAVYTYKVLADAYYNYAIQIKHTENVATFMVKQSAVIDKFLTDSITSDDSVINALRDVETTNEISAKGPSGMNADRAYSLDKRTYDESMLNVLGMSTGFAGNSGVTRQATLNSNITAEGYVKTINGNTNKMNTANSLTATEALTPFGSTHDDPMRTAMTFIQTAKHQVRTVDADPLLVTNGSDEAMPYLSSDRFAFKAKDDGKILEVTDNYILIQYNNGKKDYVNLMEQIEKNSDGGYFVPLKLNPAKNIKEKVSIKKGQIIAYDRDSYDNSIGESDNLSYLIGKLAKIAIVNTDEGFEDSAIISQRMAEKLATRIDYKSDIMLHKESTIFSMVKVGDHIEAGEPLIVYQSPYEDEDANKLLKVMSDDSVSELGKRKVRSTVTGTITAIKIFRTVETNEMSDSMKKIVNAYEKPLKAMHKKLEENGLDTSQVPAHYVLPLTGKLKKAEDSILIELYVEFLDTLGVGDKIVYYSANKGVEKDIFPVGQEPYTEYRPNEKIDAFAGETSIMKRMVASTITIGSINKLMVELDRHVKDIMDIPYDDSEV